MKEFIICDRGIRFYALVLMNRTGATVLDGLELNSSGTADAVRRDHHERKTDIDL